MISVTFNDEHVPDSPFRVPMIPSTGDARKVTVQSLKQKGLEVCIYHLSPSTCQACQPYLHVVYGITT